MHLVKSGTFKKIKFCEAHPLTGYPIDHNLASVTVIAADALSADAWATALTVLGEAKGRALAEQYGVAAYFVQRQGNSNDSGNGSDNGSYLTSASSAFAV